jgi:hypothetical protein
VNGRDDRDLADVDGMDPRADVRGICRQTVEKAFKHGSRAGAAGLCQETVPAAPVALKRNEQTAMKLTDETAGQRALRVKPREVRAGARPGRHRGSGSDAGAVPPWRRRRPQSPADTAGYLLVSEPMTPAVWTRTETRHLRLTKTACRQPEHNAWSDCAEDAGFEPARGCPQHAFQACALGH